MFHTVAAAYNDRYNNRDDKATKPDNRDKFARLIFRTSRSLLFRSTYIVYMHTTVSITTGLAITRTTLVWGSKVRRVMRAMAVVVLVVVVVMVVVVVVVVVVGSD